MADADLVAVKLRNQILETADAELVAAVKTARENGHSWNKIAEAMGMSRQSVSERFGRVVA
jgi:DNA-binding phage protein